MYVTTSEINYHSVYLFPGTEFVFKTYFKGSSFSHYAIHPADWPEYLLAIDGRSLVVKVSVA